MKQTYLLIEQTCYVTQRNHIEDIHGVSEDVEVLKQVALEENNDEPLEWKRGAMSLTPYARRTNGKNEKTEFLIIKTNDYGILIDYKF